MQLPLVLPGAVHQLAPTKVRPGGSVSTKAMSSEARYEAQVGPALWTLISYENASPGATGSSEAVLVIESTGAMTCVVRLALAVAVPKFELTLAVLAIGPGLVGAVT